MIYLLTDDLAGRARRNALEAALGDPSTASLNTSTFDGARLELSELIGAAEAMPFLAERRLVLVRGLLAKAGDEGAPRRAGRSTADESLIAYFGRLPGQTDLVFVEPEPPPKGAIVRAIEKLAAQGLAEVVADLPLDERGAVEFLRKRAGEIGTRIDGQAAAALVAALGTDRRALDRELEKLSLFAGEGAPVTMEAVRELIPFADESRIFDLVDAIGARNPRAAVRAWRNLLRSGEDAHRMLSMVARQFRLLIQAAEVRAQGRPSFQMASVLGLPPSVAAGLAQQTQSWPPGALEDVMRRLVELDRESKTGGPEVEPALEGLIAELVAPRARR